VTSFSVDSDGDGIDETDHVVGTPVTIADKGTLLLNGDGTYTFTPLPDFNGAVPVVTYLVEDGIGDTNESTLTIVVTPADNIPPVAEDDGFSIYQGESVSGNLITHVDGNDGIADHDGGDGAVLTITQFNGVDLVFGADGFATVNVDGGTVTINGAGDFTYNNSDGYILGSDYPSFNYTLSDGTDTDTATVTIDISDTAPVAVDDINLIGLFEIDNSGLAEAAEVKGNIIVEGGRSSGDAPDTSPDGPVNLVHVSYAGVDYVFDSDNTSYQITTEYGVLEIHDDGAYEYSTFADMTLPTSALIDVFSYTIKDNDEANAETDSATLTFNIDLADSGGGRARGRASTSEDESIIDNSEIIDTSSSFLATSSTLNDNKSSDNPDLSDLLTSDDNNLDDYLSFNELSNDEVADNFEGELGLDAEVESVVKESEAETIVTNSLLKEGATLISDASPENVPQQIELDSNDHI
jgi:hypothetical protein